MNEIMSNLAPEGKVYQAGTLSGNPIAMAAGLETIKTLYNNPSIFESINKKTERLHIGFKNIVKKKELNCQINRLGSMISVHFTKEPVIDFKTALLGNNDLFKKYFHGMLSQNIYLPPSAFESYFLNDAISNDDIDKTIEAFEKVISKLI